MKRIKGDKKGAALVVAVVILLLVMILSLSLVFVSYSLYHTAFRQNRMEQCKEIAQGVSKELEAEIVELSYPSPKELLDGLEKNEHELWNYLRCNLWQTGWPYYNENENRHSMKEACRTFEFQVKGTEEMPGTVTVDMYWESERDVEPFVTPFFIRVTCAIGKQKSTITTEYDLHIEKYTDDVIGDVSSEDLDLIPQSADYNPEGNTIHLDEKWEIVFTERE